jgi:hypothetical protein
MEIRLELDEQLVRRVEQIAREAGCTVADVTAAALDLIAKLPAETVDSLRYINESGSPADVARLTSGVARAITDAEYELSYRQVVASIPARVVEGLHSEEDIIAEAVRLTSRPRSSGTQSDR